MISQTQKMYFREIAKEFWHNKCAYCGRALKKHYCNAQMTIDHVVPICDGGSHKLINLVPACRSCNHSKGRRYVGSWLKKSRVKTFEQKYRRYITFLDQRERKLISMRALKIA